MQTQNTVVRSTNRALFVSAELDKFGNIVAEIKSQDRKGVSHFVAVQPGTKLCACSCEHFTYRCAKHRPTLDSEHICKHIRAGQGELSRMAGAK